MIEYDMPANLNFAISLRRRLRQNLILLTGFLYLGLLLIAPFWHLIKLLSR